MADLNVALILKLVDRATGPAKAAMQALRRIGGDEIMRQASVVHRGSLMMADGLGTVAGRATRLVDSLASVQGLLVGFGLYRLGASAIDTAAQFERFNVQLTNLEGSAEGAKKAMGWIEDFATRTPLEMDQTVAAYAKLRAFGIDPTNGSMQALVDTMAASGGDVETMNGLVLAFGQAWTKGKLQGEEAMQMLERGVPVWDILAKGMGKTTAEVMKMSEKGELGREQIKLLMDELGKRNAGAGANMAGTWGGVISNLQDIWSKFMRAVMDAGVFDFLKSNLQSLLVFLQQAAADGRLQAWAEQTATTILAVLRGLWAFGKGVYKTWVAVWPVLDQFAQSVGGWDVVGWAAAFLFFRGTIFAFGQGLWMLARGAFVVAPALWAMLGPLVRIAWVLLGNAVQAAVLALEWALVAAGRAALWLGRAFLIAGRFLLANPIIAVITAIAGLAYVIYQNWDGIVGYFTEKIDRVRAAFDEGLLNGVLKLLSDFNPFKLMADAAVGLLEYLTGWDLSGVKAHLYDAFAINLFDAGVAMILSLWDGIKAKIGEMTAWVKEQLTSMMPDWLTATNATGVGPETSGGYDAMGNPVRELGGPVRAGQTYMTGERGRELFTPDRDGYIIPNRKLAQGGGRAAPSIAVGGITINATPGMSPRAIAKAVRRELDDIARANRRALDDGGAHA